MKKKLIFVCEFFLPEYIRRFNFSFFKKKGFDVYIVDLRYIVFPHYRKKINYSFKNFLFKYICIKKISDWNSLKSKLNNKYTFFWKHYYSLNFITLKISIDISKFFFFKTYNDNYTIDFKKKI